VAHCQPLPGAGEFELPLQRPQSSFCEVSEAGRPEAVPEEGAAADGVSLFFPSSVPSLDEPPPQPATSNAAAAAAVHRAKRVMSFPLARDPLEVADHMQAILGVVGQPPPSPVDNALTCIFL
jgi:hypothetical protein